MKLVAKPSLWRYLAILVYDGILLIAVLFFATFLALPFNNGTAFSGENAWFPCYLFLVSFCFYTWFWTHGGQTLGLSSWNAKVVSSTGRPLSWRQAFTRFVAALLSWACLGLGFIWLAIDSKGRTWHDILSKTEVVLTRKHKQSQ